MAPELLELMGLLWNGGGIESNFKLLRMHAMNLCVVEN